MAPGRRLPNDLAGPVPLALARTAESVPAEASCRGGCRYEIKWDGFRAAIVRTTKGARIWSRRGTDLTLAFPDLAAAAEHHLEPGTVLDGEAVIWADGRLSFDALQLRLARRRSRGTPPSPPANYVAFDVLAHAGEDLRGLGYDDRRRLLQQLAAAWEPPLELCPSTRQRDEALRWYEDYPPAGIEGLVVKSAAGKYPVGRSDWIKVKNRATCEVVVGAVTGSLDQPDAVIAGAFRDGELVIVGRTGPLTAAQTRELTRHLAAAGADHPWPDEIGSGVFGQRQRVQLVKVAPLVVIEVAADSAHEGGRYRHALRYIRMRSDILPRDVRPP